MDPCSNVCDACLSVPSVPNYVELELKKIAWATAMVIALDGYSLHVHFGLDPEAMPLSPWALAYVENNSSFSSLLDKPSWISLMRSNVLDPSFQIPGKPRGSLCLCLCMFAWVCRVRACECV